MKKQIKRPKSESKSKVSHYLFHKFKLYPVTQFSTFIEFVPSRMLGTSKISSEEQYLSNPSNSRLKSAHTLKDVNFLRRIHASEIVPETQKACTQICNIAKSLLASFYMAWQIDRKKYDSCGNFIASQHSIRCHAKLLGKFGQLTTRVHGCGITSSDCSLWHLTHQFLAQQPQMQLVHPVSITSDKRRQSEYRG